MKGVTSVAAEHILLLHYRAPTACGVDDGVVHAGLPVTRGDGPAQDANALFWHWELTICRLPKPPNWGRLTPAAGPPWSRHSRRT